MGKKLQEVQSIVLQGKPTRCRALHSEETPQSAEHYNPRKHPQQSRAFCCWDDSLGAEFCAQSVPGTVFGVIRYCLVFHLEKCALLSNETINGK